jgi:hypothetical protein
MRTRKIKEGKMVKDSKIKKEVMERKNERNEQK